MSIKRVAGFFCALLLVVVGSGALLFAQTATTGLISGVVTDSTGAALPNAAVTLTERGTNSQTKVNSDAVGHFVFPAVNPSDYTVTFSAQGFQNTVVQQFHVEVNKSYTLNMSLVVGATSQTVEVTDVAAAELQTTNSTIGTVLGGVGLENLPVYTRSASALMLYQPAVSPSGQISGARLEQVTINLDGGDVTSDLEGSNSYAAPPDEPQPSPVVPVPIESTQEFQVATSNPNASFGRSSGGQVSMVTKRGTNAYHGSVYEFHNDDAFNANGWTNNFSRLHKPHSVDNRYGVAVGGPILKDRMWFFASYEGRRFFRPSVFNAVVPTPSFQSGIIKLGSASYSLQPGNISTACGGVSCDPRNIGMSPVIKAQLALYPAGNNSTLGDGLNTTGLTFVAPTPTVQNLGVLRLDYKFTDNWNIFVTDHMSDTSRTTTTQFSLLPPSAVSQDPIKPQYYSMELTGRLSNSITAVTRASWMRDWWGWNRVSPTPLVSGTLSALVLAGEGSGTNNSTGKLLADPVNLNTGNARPRFFNGKKFNIGEDLNWVRGKHLFQFGGSWYINRDVFEKTDNFSGGLTTGPELYVESTGNGSGVYLSVPSQYQPTGLSSANVLRWNELYSTLLGMVDRSSIVITRDGNFQPYPVGTPSISHTSIDAYSAYFQDIWKASNSLTMTLGVSWNAQPSPTEANGRNDVLVYASNSQPVDYWKYFEQRAASLNAGVAPGAAFNPLFGVVPVNKLTGDLKGKVRITKWDQFAPRVSAAWQPQGHNWLFGDNKTVIRGGYAMVWDRISDINEVSLVTTTGGLLDANVCGGPVLSGGSLRCTNAATNPTNAFRIGVDGNNVPVPAPTTVAIPFVPSGTAAAPFGLFMMSGLDPYAVPAHHHTFDLTVQRELPGRMVLELGYIGRLARNLPQDLAYNATDYLMKDAASGQVYAQAFDAVAQALRGGTAAAAIPVQPFFENQLGGAARCAGIATTRKLSGISTCTALMAAVDKTDFVNGSINNVSLNALNQLAASPIDNIQTFQSYAITDRGFSDYHAGFLALNKSFGRGLQFQANWTWSHSIGNQGVDQQNGSSANSPYNLNLDKASEPFDRRHVVNFWWYYELPFGKGSTAFSRLAGGWNVSGIYTFSTGVPLKISANGDYGAWESNGTAAICKAPLGSLESEHRGVVGSGGIATSGNTATGGSGINIFGDPVGVYGSCSRPLLSVNNRIPFDELHALPRWNADFSIGKKLRFTERVGMDFSAEFLNAFNTVVFNNPSLNLNSPSNFGVLNSQANTPRRILLGLKLKF